jgi:hypothetical protein
LFSWGLESVTCVAIIIAFEIGGVHEGACPAALAV